MRVDGVNSMTSEMSDFESGDLFGSTMMSDVRLHEEKKRWRTRVISLCKDQDRPLNVAIIGPPGVGKSSLVNTIGACFSDETWREYALSGYHGDARQITVFTKSFSKCCHGRDEEYANVKIPTLIDIAGFSDETGEISVELLRIVFYGRLPEEESLAEAADYAKKYGLDGLRKKYAANDEKLKVDRIIIVSAATSLVPKKLIQCVLDAARPSGLDEKRKRTIPLFGVLTKQDKIGSAQISAEEYEEREKQFINAVGLVGSEHRLLRCRNYCDDVDHGRRVETVIPEIDLPVLRFMSQVADPVFEVANEGERYVESEDAQGKEPDTELRRRQPSTTSAADSTTEPRQRVSARRADPKLYQEFSRTKSDVSFYGQLVVGALLVVLVLQFVLVPPVDIVKLRGYCKYVQNQNHNHDLREICATVSSFTKMQMSCVCAFVFVVIQLIVKWAFEKFEAMRG